MWKALCAEPGGPARELKALPEVAAAAAGRGILWLDLTEPSAEETALLSETFRLDPLVVEDIVSEVHHPKIDDYKDYIYLVLHGVRAGAVRGAVKTLELDVVLSGNYLITHHADPMRSVVQTFERALKQGGFLSRGTDATLQAILATQASHFIEEVEKLENEVLSVEEELFHAKPTQVLRQLFEIKSDIARVRRVLGSQREVLHRLSRGEFKQITQKLLMHFRDVYDDAYRATEMLDMLRDISMAALETHLTLTANKTNETMKVLTILSTFILPLSLVTGWYGMNFDHLHGIHSPYGEYFVVGLFAVISGGLWVFLRRKKWL